ADSDEHSQDLAVQLQPYVSGSYSELFREPTTQRPSGHLVSWSLRRLPDELKAVATLMALDSIWRTVADATPDHPRMVLVDEGWILMQEPEGARFLFRLAKAPGTLGLLHEDPPLIHQHHAGARGCPVPVPTGQGRPEKMDGLRPGHAGCR